MNLTPKQLEKDVKRINERINEVVKLLGNDSEAYNKYVSRIKALLPESFTRIDKDGLVKIARKKELYQRAGDEKIQRAIEQILKVPTAGNIKAHAKSVIIKERRKKQEDMMLSLPPEFSDDNTQVQYPFNAMVITPAKPTKEEIEDMTRQIDAIQKFVTDNQEMFYMDYGGAGSEINKLIHGKGKRSYDELQTIINAYNSKKYTIRTDIFSDIE